MCLHSQLLWTGSSGQWLKQKKLWASISGSSPFPAGPGSCCPLPGPLDSPTLFRHWESKPEMRPSLPGGHTGSPVLSSGLCPSLPVLLQALHRVPMPQGPAIVTFSAGARGGGDSPAPWKPPRGAAALGHVPMVPIRAEMGTQARSGCGTGGSWGHGAASPGHSEEKGGCKGTSCFPELMSWGGSAVGGSREDWNDNRS